MNRAITPGRLFGFFAIFIVWLNITYIHLQISAYAGLSFRDVGTICIAILLLYILVNHERALVVLRNKQSMFFLIIFNIIPAFSIVIAPTPLLAVAAYSILSGLIFLTVMIWIQQEGVKRFNYVMLAAWAFSIFGILLSYRYPELFKKVAVMQQSIKLSGASSWYDAPIAQASAGRAFGFYMQSNTACTAITFMLVVLLPVCLHNKPLLRIIVISITLLAVLLTGSRGGFLCLVAVIGVAFIGELLRGHIKSGRLQSVSTLLPMYFAFILLVFGAFFVAQSLQSGVKSDVSAIDRIISTFFEENSSIGGDLSVRVRFSAQREYISHILSSPVYGYGQGAATIRVNERAMFASSHNSFLETAYAFGIPMALLMYGFFIHLLVSREAKEMTLYFRYNLTLLLVVFVMVTSMISDTVFDYRVFPTVMAFCLTMLYFPFAYAQSYAPSQPQPEAR